MPLCACREADAVNKAFVWKFSNIGHAKQIVIEMVPETNAEAPDSQPIFTIPKHIMAKSLPLWSLCSLW